MLKDEKVRALATEFGCQWLDVRGFDTFNEKSEQVFPQFAALRGAMYEESVRFFIDLFQRNGSVLEVLDADHTFVNEALRRLWHSEREWTRVAASRWDQVTRPRGNPRHGDLAVEAIGRVANQPDLAR